jgi:hypothetical protein
VIPLAEYQRRRKDLEQRGEALAAQERQLQAQSRQRMELAGVAGSIEDFCERVRGGLADATFEQKRKLMELLIDRVIVTGEEVEIRYVIPTDPSSEHVRFCHLRSDYLHNPTPRQELKASARHQPLPVDLLTFLCPLLGPDSCHLIWRRLWGTMHHLDAQAEHLFCPLFPPSLVAGIYPQVRKARKAIAYTLQQQFNPILIGNLGAVHLSL